MVPYTEAKGTRARCILSLVGAHFVELSLGYPKEGVSEAAEGVSVWESKSSSGSEIKMSCTVSLHRN